MSGDDPYVFEVSEAAEQALKYSPDWLYRAYELVPEILDLQSTLVRGGFFVVDGTVRGLIWDLLGQVRERNDDEFTERAFQFIVEQVEVGSEAARNTALIGFLCKIASPDVSPMSLDELAARLPESLIETHADLFGFHYGPEGLARMRRAKSCRGVH